jgi:tRNA A-37 threonylcarbamoyl transferase component Bud32
MTIDMLLPPDPAVPHRDRLLDARGMRQHFQGSIGVPEERSIAPLRIKYRPSESLRVVYRIGREQPAIVTARTFPPEQARARLAASGADFTVPELGAAFWTFPHDRRLRNIEQLLHPDHELRARLPEWVTSRLAGYAPEKCAVLACLDRAGRTVAFAKVFSDHQAFARVRALHEAIASGLDPNEELAIPPVVADLPALRTVFVAPARGKRIADLTRDLLPRALNRMGRAVARLHQSGIPTAARCWHRTTPTALRDAALLVGQVRPSLKHSALLVASDLMATRHDSEEAVLLHGDLHLKNAFLHRQRVSLIDLDQAASGPAAADIGSLLVALHARGGIPNHHFLEGYAAIRRLPSREAIAWHIAAALLTERAVRAITRVRLQALYDLDHMIDQARILAAAARTRP